MKAVRLHYMPILGEPSGSPFFYRLFQISVRLLYIFDVINHVLEGTQLMSYRFTDVCGAVFLEE